MYQEKILHYSIYSESFHWVSDVVPNAQEYCILLGQMKGKALRHATSPVEGAFGHLVWGQHPSSPTAIYPKYSHELSTQNHSALACPFLGLQAS